MPTSVIPIRQINLPVSVQKVPLSIWLNGTQTLIQVTTQTIQPIPVITKQINLSIGAASVQLKIQPINVLLPITGAESGLPGPPGPSGALQMVWGETPSGVINGVNMNYTTAYPYIAKLLAVFLNGLRQQRNNDYIETGSQSFQFLNAPLPGDSLSIDYTQP